MYLNQTRAEERHLSYIIRGAEWPSRVCDSSNSESITKSAGAEWEGRLKGNSGAINLSVHNLLNSRIVLLFNINER
jgi:hypothetical protein